MAAMVLYNLLLVFNAAIRFNKTCKIKQLKPVYMSIKINGNNRQELLKMDIYEGWNFNSGNYLFTTDTK